jgi:predicted  nucleic acid-binding Zn-ribbon protein
MTKFCILDELNLLRKRVEQLEIMYSSLRKSMSDLEKKMKNQKAGGGGADQGAVDAIMDELNRLRKEFEQFRDASEKRIGYLETEMPHKADKRDLEELENRIMEKLRDMIQQILNQFANKEDVMKRFAQLSKKIREIMELLAR